MVLKLTRRSVVVGATALTVSSMRPLTLMAQEARVYHALLIGCTAYPNLPPRATLIGPNHDAALVRDYLTQNSPVKFLSENVTVLADGLAGVAGSPTREAILSNLGAIAAKAKRNDFIYIHYSGHGSNQPELTSGDESDGLDEIILPSDTGKWTDRTKGVPNALVDNDIGTALEAIRAKGAFVWIIFDCCNSGTATRAASLGDDDVQERKVDPSDLGIPDAVMQAAVNAQASRGVGDVEAPRAAAFSLVSEPTGAATIARGDIVAFYAAQTIETTPEMPLPKGDPQAARFGLFTYTIFSKLAENSNVTYRQLGHAVLQQYAADGRTRPTPLFEGTLDARVFRSEIVDTPMQWQIEIEEGKATLAAGAMHRLTPGSKLAILPSPLSELSEAVGYMEVVSAKNLTSVVASVEHDGMPALKVADIPPKAYARVAQLEIDFKLVVARPSVSEGLDEQVALVNQTLDELAAAADRKFKVKLVEPGEEADIRLAVLRENAIPGAATDATDSPAVWFLPPSGDVTLKDGSRPPLVAAVDPKRLKIGTDEVLTKIFRATGLSRLAAGSDYKPDQVSVEFLIKRQRKDAMELLKESEVPRVNPGDEVHILAKNLSSGLVDINVLYVGSDYSITHIDAQRLVPNATVEKGLLAFTDTSYGMERMIAVLTEAPPLSELEDLSFLTQGGVPPATRSASGPSGFSDMLRDIGMAPATRSVMKLGDKSTPKGAVMIFPLETVPVA